MERIIEDGLFSNGNNFQTIKINNNLDCLVDCFGNVFSRHNKSQLAEFAFELNYDEWLDMSLWEVKQAYLEYRQENMIYDR